MIAYLQTFEWGVDFVEDNVGEPMTAMTSKLYARRGIKKGDTVYLAYIDERRRLNLVSKTSGRIRASWSTRRGGRAHRGAWYKHSHAA